MNSWKDKLRILVALAVGSVIFIGIMAGLVLILRWIVKYI